MPERVTSVAAAGSLCWRTAGDMRPSMSIGIHFILTVHRRMRWPSRRR